MSVQKIDNEFSAEDLARNLFHRCFYKRGSTKKGGHNLLEICECIGLHGMEYTFTGGMARFLENQEDNSVLMFIIKEKKHVHNIVKGLRQLQKVGIMFSLDEFIGQISNATSNEHAQRAAFAREMKNKLGAWSLNKDDFLPSKHR